MRTKITVFLMTVWPENLHGKILTWWLNVGVYLLRPGLQWNCFQKVLTFQLFLPTLTVVWYLYEYFWWQDLWSQVRREIKEPPPRMLRTSRVVGSLEEILWLWDSSEPFIIKTNVESFILKSKLSVFCT